MNPRTIRNTTLFTRAEDDVVTWVAAQRSCSKGEVLRRGVVLAKLELESEIAQRERILEQGSRIVNLLLATAPDLLPDGLDSPAEPEWDEAGHVAIRVEDVRYFEGAEGELLAARHTGDRSEFFRVTADGLVPAGQLQQPARDPSMN